MSSFLSHLVQQILPSNAKSGAPPVRPMTKTGFEMREAELSEVDEEARSGAPHEAIERKTVNPIASAAASAPADDPGAGGERPRSNSAHDDADGEDDEVIDEAAPTRRFVNVAEKRAARNSERAEPSAARIVTRAIKSSSTSNTQNTSSVAPAIATMPHVPAPTAPRVEQAVASVATLLKRDERSERIEPVLHERKAAALSPRAEHQREESAQRNSAVVPKPAPERLFPEPTSATSSAPAVHISIGRIEVRASTPVPTPARRSNPPAVNRPGLSLGEYLARRGKGS